MIDQLKIRGVAVLLAISLGGSAQTILTTTESVGPLGTVTVYRPATIQSVALFVSGDGGWNKGVVDMARAFVGMNALVVGIDNKHYMQQLNRQKSACSYPAADLENLSLFIQKKYKLPRYLKPILMGYSSGATLVYGALAQAPAGTFGGAIGLGFCPDLDINKPFCPGNAGLKSRVLKKGKTYYLEAVDAVSAPFVAVVGQTDKVCDWQTTGKFVKQIKNATFIAPAGVGHGFLDTRKWMPQLQAAYRQLSRSGLEATRTKAPDTPNDFPLVLTLTARPTSQPLAFIISGDGGWTSFDAGLAKSLADQGIPSLGLDAQKYFWNARNPAQTAAAIAKAISYYAAAWHKPTFMLIGYSFGADVLPFVANRLPPTLHAHLRSLVMLSPSLTGDFEIHMLDMLNLSQPHPYDVVGEVARGKGLLTLCLFGKDEGITYAPRFQAAGARVLTVPGGHHYDDNYALLAAVISKQ